MVLIFREMSIWYGFHTQEMSRWYGFDTRERLRWYGKPSLKKKSQNCGLFFRTGWEGGGAQPHSVAFGGVFPNITEAILMMKFAQK